MVGGDVDAHTILPLQARARSPFAQSKIGPTVRAALQLEEAGVGRRQATIPSQSAEASSPSARAR